MADERQSLVVTTRIDEERKVLFTTFLHQHDCVVEDRGDFLRVRFPEGTRREAMLSGRDERHSITLPDKTHLVEVYIRQREYTILNIPADVRWFLGSVNASGSDPWWSPCSNAAISPPLSDRSILYQ